MKNYHRTRLGFRFPFLHRLDAAAMPAIAPSGRPVFRFLVLGLLAALVSRPASAQTAPAQSFDAAHPEKMARGLELFQKQVQSILTSSCLRCHGGKSTESGLDLSDRDPSAQRRRKRAGYPSGQCQGQPSLQAGCSPKRPAHAP